MNRADLIRTATATIATRTRSARSQSVRAVELAHAHYVIEGERFCSVAEVFRAAKARGFDGNLATMSSRIRGSARLALTWARLARPVDHERAAGRARAIESGRDEAAEAARRVDERKAAIAASLSNEEE